MNELTESDSGPASSLRLKWEDEFVHLLTRNPLESLTGLLLGGSLLFYAAERGVNTKVQSFWDALYHISTCASVGYADIFAKTEVGKAVSSVVFMFGPALCGKVFDRPTPQGPAANPQMQAVVERLDAILAEMRRSRAL